MTIKPMKTIQFRVVGWGEKPFAFCNSGKIALALPSRVKVMNTNTWFTELQVEIEAAITVSASPDGRKLVIGCDLERDNLFVIDLHNLTRKYLKGHSRGVHSVSWSKNGRWIASASSDSSVIIWDAQNFTPVKKIRTGSFVYVVSWSPDSKWLAFGTASGRIVVVKAGSWNEVMDIDPNHGSIYSIDWSYDGKKLAVSTGWPDNTLLVFASRTWKPIMETMPHMATIWSISWSPENDYIVTASGDSTLKILDSHTGEVVDSFRSPTSWFESVLWTPKAIFATQWDGTFQALQWSNTGSQFVVRSRPTESESYVVDNSPPEIEILSPEIDQDGRGVVYLTAREGQTITLLGIAKDNSGIMSVLVNSVEADVTNVNNGVKFKAYVPIHEGTNVIKVTAIDNNGNKSRQNLVIYGESSPINTGVGEIWAVVIGVNTYADPAINLKYAASDARSFANFLVGPHVGARSDHVITLINRNATRANILKNLMRVAKIADENDLVIVYMAMHALPALGKLYFLPHDGDPTNIVGTGISRDDVIDIFEWPDKKLRVLFIFDVCHAGAFDMIAEFPSENMRVRTVLARTTNELLYRIASSHSGISILASTSVYDLSYEDDKLKHGIFTHYLIDGLKGRADSNKDGIVILGEIADYVRKKVAAATDGKQVPQMRGDRKLPLSKVY